LIVNPRGAHYRPIVVSAIVSAVLFYSGVFSFLFAVPVQVNYSRRGAPLGIRSALATGALIIIVHLAQVLRLDGVQGETVRLLLLDSLMPIGVLLAVSLFNLLRSITWAYRLLVATVPALLASLPSIVILVAASSGDGPLGEQLSEMLSALGMGVNLEYWLAAVRRIVLNTVGVGLLASVAANWWIGRSIVLRGSAGSASLRDARVPDPMVWFVIAGLAGVLFAWLAGPAALEPLAWNIMLVAAFTYGVQGIGLIQHLLRRRGLSERSERWVLTLSLVALFLPGINVLAAIGIPLLGMSEIWIDFKRGEKYEGHSE